MISNAAQTQREPITERVETLILAAVLVAAFHAIPWWIYTFLPRQQIFERLGPNGYATLYDALSLVAPLFLCVGAPRRSGLTLGQWEGRALKVIGICALPIVLTALISPFTSRPFSGDRVGVWLISPLAQDLMFAGYLYGLFAAGFRGGIAERIPIRRAVLITPFFFMLWHVPNFHGMAASFVIFQLFYTAVGYAWMLLARQLTGSIAPVVFIHMACNFIAWL